MTTAAMPFIITGGIKLAGYYLFALLFFAYYNRRPPTIPRLDDAGFIVEDRFCTQCDYNVRGLRQGGTCPECGAVVAQLPPTEPTESRRSKYVNPLLFAVIRTAIGLAIGGIYWSLIPDRNRTDFPIAWACIAPIRALEWLFVALIFHRSFANDHRKIKELTVLGTIWSYVLDAPVIFGFCTYYGVPC